MWEVVRELLPVVVVIYLLECVAWLRPSHALFVSWWPDRFRLLQAGVRFAGWWPAGKAYVTHRLRLVWTPRGLFVPVQREVSEATGNIGWKSEAYDFLPYEDLASAEREHHTAVLGTGHALKLPSRAHAEDVLWRLAELRRLPAAKRARYLEKKLIQETDLRAFRAHELRLSHLRFPLALASLVLFASFFVALPLAVYVDALEDWLVPALALASFGYVSVFVLSIAIVRRQRKRGGVRTRGLLLPILLSPVAAARASVGLLRDLCHPFDALTLAAAFLPKRQFLELARTEVHFSRLATADGEEAWRWFWEKREKQVSALIRALGASEAEALAPPERREPAASGWCPLCGTEYLPDITECDDCAAPVQPFAPATVAAS